MRRLSLRLAVGLLTFVVGVSAAAIWYMNRPAFSRAAEEDNITEHVFRHQIAEESQPGAGGVFFLSRGIDTDPSDGFMQRFAGLPGARKFSQGNRRWDGVTDKQTGERGTILEAHRIEWVNDAEVEADVRTYAWSMGQSGSACRVVREDGEWVLKGCRVSYIT